MHKWCTDEPGASPQGTPRGSASGEWTNGHQDWRTNRVTDTQTGSCSCGFCSARSDSEPGEKPTQHCTSSLHSHSCSQRPHVVSPRLQGSVLPGTDAAQTSFFYTNNKTTAASKHACPDSQFQWVLWELPSTMCTNIQQLIPVQSTRTCANTWTSASYHGHRLLEVRRFSFHPLLGHCPKGPDGHLGAIRRTTHNFWSHPASNAHHGAPLILLRGQLSAEAKISWGQKQTC